MNMLHYHTQLMNILYNIYKEKRGFVMPRYPLIMKNQTYIILLQESARRGLSLGKYLNQIINKEAERLQSDGHPAIQAICIACGKKATIEAHGQGQQKFLCAPIIRGWREK